MTSPSPHRIAQDEAPLFALRLARIATLTALGVTDENYYQQLFKRQTDWLTCLINSANENVIYDLRLISQPDINNLQRGRLTVAILCHSKSNTDSAEALAAQLKSLFESFFDNEYEFDIVTDPDQLQSLLSPFPAKCTAELARRADYLALDSLRNKPAKQIRGFAPVSPQLQNAVPADVYHVYPFLVNPTAQTHLHNLLLRQAYPLMISVRLQPTSVTAEEQEFIEGQIALCERYGQVTLNNPTEDLNFLWPTLQQQSRTVQRQFVRTLYSLKDNAALCRIQIISTADIPHFVLDALGSAITLPAGGQGASEYLDHYLSGGYECLFNSDSETVPVDPSLPLPARRLRFLFDALEAASAFRFPAPTIEEPPGLPAKTSRTQPPPALMPDTGHCIGESHHNGRTQSIFLEPADRRRHLYVVGQTGTGKSTMFESMILDDIRSGEGLCLIDPHGDLVEKVLAKIPSRRVKDVILVDPAESDRPIGFNLLEYETEAQKYFLVQEVVGIVETLSDRYDPSMLGPMFFQHARMNLLLVMARPESPGTLVQFYQIFNSNKFYRKFLPLPSSNSDPMLRKFVDEVLPKMEYATVRYDGTSMGSYVSSKFADFVSDPMLRNIFGQQRSTINLRDIMDSGKILLVNLSKGRLGEINSRMFGMFLIAKLQAAAMGRAAVPIEKRRDFFLYVDEFQNLATVNFGSLLSEARKYRLNLILTNQYVTQVDPRISSAISGNVGTIIAFRTGALDAEFLEREFVPVFNRYDLMQLPNFTSCVSTLVNGQVCRPFTMRNRLDALEPDPERSRQIRSHSRQEYGRARSQVEREILESLRMELTPD